MSAVLEWCDPTRGPGRPRVWAPLLLPLYERPGRWALIRRYDRPDLAYGAAKDLRRGARGVGSTAVPPGAWEFRSQQIEPEVIGWGVYARYLGPGAA